MAADLGQVAAALASFEAQRAQKQAERDQLVLTIASQKNLVATLQQRVDMRTQLVTMNAGAKAAVIDATETLQYQITQLAIQQGQLAWASRGLDVFDNDMQKTIEAFLADNAEKLSEAERQAEELEQKLAKAEAAIDHLTLKAPISGTVQASALTTIGQVVSSGQEIMRIVPEDAGLEIEVYVLNKDIGFVKPGQEAVVKIESFPFTQYGTILAHVTRVARDSIPEPEANQNEGDPARAAASSTFAGAQRTQNLVFRHARAGSRRDRRRWPPRAADIRDGRHRRDQDWRAPNPRVHLLAARRGGRGRHAGAVSRLRGASASGACPRAITKATPKDN